MSFKPACGVKPAALDPEVAVGALDVAKMVIPRRAWTGPSATGLQPAYCSGSRRTS